MAKLWLFQLNNKKRATLPESELDSSKMEVWRRLEGRLVSGSRSRKLWPRIGIAAAVAAVIVSAGIWFMNKPEKANLQDQPLYVQDVAPGKQGATLTLSNGERIRLSDASNGELANEAGVKISKSADGQLVYEVNNSGGDPNKINTLSTSKGETYRVKLPDGSVVWLNAASKLSYVVGLINNGKRHVKLEGEGFFDVTEDKFHPFVVQTTGQQVEVLGTEFNINSYPDEPVVTTTLVEGSVKVRSKDKEQTIRPGQQTVNSSGELRVAEVKVDTYTDWKDGDFNLDELDFKVAMRKIARWYDVDVVFSPSISDNMRSWGWISRNKKLSEVLEFIEASGRVRFKLEGKRLEVSAR